MGFNLPLPPRSAVEEPIRKYFRMGLNDKEILNKIQKEVIRDNPWGMSLKSLKNIRKDMRLLSVRQQNHTVDTIKDAMQVLREKYPSAGTRDMISRIGEEYGMKVSRSVMTEYFKQEEQGLAATRKANRLRRKRFWAAGVNDLWAIDQHDKWKYKFGLALHVGLDPVGGFILWLKIWWTNSNPKLIFSYYLEVVVHLGYMPMITQSDGGPENHGVARGHSWLRQWHDPGLVGTLQHRWTKNKKNIPPEICWSQLRARWTPGFEAKLDEGIENNWYDPDDYIDAMVFRWVFIPWLQRELDLERDRVNQFRKRADKKKIMPTGRPIEIHEHPEEFDLKDFKIHVQNEALAEVQELYAPPNDPVFELVPPEFAQMVDAAYEEIGRPTVTRDSCWDIYLQIRDYIRGMEEYLALHEEDWREMILQDRQDNEFPEDTFEDMNQGLAGGDGGLQEDGTFYLGGLNGGLGPGFEVDFTPGNAQSDTGNSPDSEGEDTLQLAPGYIELDIELDESEDNPTPASGGGRFYAEFSDPEE